MASTPSETSPGDAPLPPLGAFSLLAVASLTIMVGCVVVPGLPSIAQALQIGESAGWLVTLPSLGVVIFGPLAGRMIDRIGAHPALCVGLVMYAVLGLAVMVLRGPIAVYIDRIMLGGATVLVMSGGTALISELYSGRARMTMMARQGMAIELGGVVFLAIGGILTNCGWAAPFALYGMAFVFLFMVVVSVPSTARAASHEIITTADNRQEARLGSVYFAAGSSMALFFAAVINLPFRLSTSGPDQLSLTEAQVGYFLSFVSLVAVGAAAIMPRVAHAFGERTALVIAFVLYGGAHLCFAIGTTFPTMIVGAVLLGMGFGLSVPLVNYMTVDRSTALCRGRNLAYLSMAIFLGQFLASPLEYFSGGTKNSFLAAGLLGFSVAAFGLSRRKGTQ